MLFFLFLLAIFVPLLVVGVLVNYSPSAIFVVLTILAVIWIAQKSYEDWRLKQESQREESEPLPYQQDIEPPVASADESEKTRCPYCGNVYDKKENFCPNCGVKKT